MTNALEDEQRKRDVIKNYLETKFLGSVVCMEVEFDTDCEKFKVYLNEKRYLLKIERRIFKNLTIENIATILDNNNVVSKLKEASEVEEDLRIFELKNEHCIW